MRLRGLLIMLWMVAFSLQAVAQTDYRPGTDGLSPNAERGEVVGLVFCQYTIS